ncbi:hypothetical protein ACFQ0B_23895 [Nonomuraea thailandensis]
MRELEIFDPGTELLPDPFVQRDLGDLSLAAQPFLDFGQGEQRTAGCPADRLREVVESATPVADGGAPNPRQPCDVGRCDRGAVLQNLHSNPDRAAAYR